MAMQDTAGSSKPSVRTPTLVNTWIRSSRKACNTRARSSALELAVDDSGRNPERRQSLGKVGRVRDRHAERNGAAVAREFLDGARDERVAVLDVDRLLEALDIQIPARGSDIAEIGCGLDAEAPQRHEVPILDHLVQIAGVRDLLEDVVQPEPVRTIRRGREAEQRARPVPVEAAEFCQHALVVIRIAWWHFVIDDKSEIPGRPKPRQPARMQAADARHHRLDPLHGAKASLFHCDERGIPQSPAELVGGLLDQFRPVCEHEHRTTGHAGEFGEDDGLAGPRGQGDQHPSQSAFAAVHDGTDRIPLVGAEGEALAHGHPSVAGYRYARPSRPQPRGPHPRCKIRRTPPL